MKTVVSIADDLMIQIQTLSSVSEVIMEAHSRGKHFNDNHFSTYFDLIIVFGIFMR